MPDKKIDKWIDGGIQQKLHMTILYGVNPEEEKEISEIVKLFTEEGIEAKSGEIEYFDDDKKKHTCVVLRVESDELKALHDLLKDEVSNKDSYPTYKAHIAIAYIKHKERLGDIKIKAVTWKVKSIEMSQKDGGLKKVSKLYKRATSEYLSKEDVDAIKQIVLEGGGMEPIGVQEYMDVDMGIIVFFHDNHKSQTSLPLEELSIENVAKKVTEKDMIWESFKQTKIADLEEYKHKRDFTLTDEPEGTVRENADMIWVLQRHQAEKAGLHGDFRLQEEGVLKSFVIRKLDEFLSGKLNRVMVINTEDHPIEYAEFEGDIPSGEYGGGRMDIEDAGTYETVVKTDKEWTIWLDSDTGKMKGLFSLVLADPKKFGKDKWFLIRKQELEVKKESIAVPA